MWIIDLVYFYIVIYLIKDRELLKTNFLCIHFSDWKSWRLGYSDHAETESERDKSGRQRLIWNIISFVLGKWELLKDYGLQ